MRKGKRRKEGIDLGQEGVHVAKRAAIPKARNTSSRRRSSAADGETTESEEEMVPHNPPTRLAPPPVAWDD